MKSITTGLHIALILGFLAVDFLLFHDFLKVGETHTFVEYLVGVLSILVIVNSARALFTNASALGV